jgi:hypothetical protein
MRAMRKQMIYTLIIILAFVVFQLLHRGGPMQLPKDAIVQGSTVQVPVNVVQTKQEMQQNWSLYEGQEQRWSVIAHNGRQTFEYTSQEALQNGSHNGTDYVTSGTIQFNGQTYAAQIIHVNSAETKGYILFRSLKAPATGNLTSPSTSPRAGGNTVTSNS